MVQLVAYDIILTACHSFTTAQANDINTTLVDFSDLAFVFTHKKSQLSAIQKINFEK